MESAHDPRQTGQPPYSPLQDALTREHDGGRHELLTALAHRALVVDELDVAVAQLEHGDVRRGADGERA